MNTTAMIFDSFPCPAHWYEAMDEGARTASPPVAWLARMRQSLARWAQQAVLSHAESPLWDIARSDPRVTAELMLARKADNGVETPADQPQVMSAINDADTVAAVVPRRVAALLGQGWARVIEDAYQTRSRDALWRGA